MQFGTFLVILLAIMFVIPIFGGVGVPRDFSAEEVGRFLYQVFHYWVKVFSAGGKNAGAAAFDA